MRINHRGYEINVTQELSMSGEVLLFWSIFRELDGYECDSGFSYGTESVEEYTELMKQRIDAELSEDDPWMERERSEGVLRWPQATEEGA